MHPCGVVDIGPTLKQQIVRCFRAIRISVREIRKAGQYVYRGPKTGGTRTQHKRCAYWIVRIGGAATANPNLGNYSNARSGQSGPLKRDIELVAACRALAHGKDNASDNLRGFDTCDWQR